MGTVSFLNNFFLNKNKQIIWGGEEGAGVGDRNAYWERLLGMDAHQT